MTPKKILNFSFALFLSLGILYFLLRNINFDQFFVTLKKGSPLFWGMVVIGHLILYLIRTLRFSLIIAKSPSKIFLISAIHNFLNKLLPFRSGELSWPLLLKKYLGVKLTHGFGLLLLIRYLDILAIVSLFLIASSILQLSFITPLLQGILSLILLGGFLSLYYIKHLIKLLRKGCDFLPFQFLHSNAGIFISKLDDLEKTFHKTHSRSLLLFLILLSFFNWLAIYLIYYFYILMFHFELSFVHVIAASVFVTLVNLLPVNGVGRLGTFELGWAAGFILLGMTKELAIPLGLFVNVGNTFISFLLATISYIWLMNS